MQQVFEQFPQNNRKFFLCGCHSEGVMLCSEGPEDKCEGFIELSFFSLYGNSKLFSWRDRIRLIWRIIREGHPYLDMVTLPPEVAKDLGIALIDAGQKASVK